jgi:carboxymethylenebutenolidase
MAGNKVTLTNKDGTFGGYLASPASGEGPGILVIQEIFGVNEFVREICDYHASQGRFALAPDLFWRLEPGVDITDKSEEHWQKAFSLMQAFNVDTGMEDIQTGISYLRGLAGCNGKVGAVGYCLGGQLAYLSATRTDSDASVGYYGVYIQDRLDEAAKITKPVMLHIAENDQFVPQEAQAMINDGLKDIAHVTRHSYPEMEHAFASTGGQHYDKSSADLANTRSETFFRQHLG